MTNSNKDRDIHEIFDILKSWQRVDGSTFTKSQWRSLQAAVSPVVRPDAPAPAPKAKAKASISQILPMWQIIGSISKSFCTESHSESVCVENLGKSIVKNNFPQAEVLQAHLFKSVRLSTIHDVGGILSDNHAKDRSKFYITLLDSEFPNKMEVFYTVNMMMGGESS